MENRSFRTALLGGFRKKDVVNFLAEDKRRQEETLQDLHTQLEEAAAQIGELMAQRDAALEQAQSRQEALLQTEGDLGSLTEEVQALRQEKARLEEDLQARTARNEELEGQVACLESRAAAQPQVDSQELQALREQLYAARLRAEELDARLGQQPQTKAAGQSMDQLWSLCGKMERTLGQMERLLDGPYRMTCYPEPMETPVEMAAEPVEPTAPAVQEILNDAVPENAPPTQAPSVKNLLQRIRVKR